MKGLTNVAASVQETTRYHCRMSRQGMTRPTGTETGPPGQWCGTQDTIPSVDSILILSFSIYSIMSLQQGR